MARPAIPSPLDRLRQLGHRPTMTGTQAADPPVAANHDDTEVTDAPRASLSIELPTRRAGNEDYSVEARGTFTDKDANGYVPTPESEMLRVRLQQFEGPLDLLLFLIDKHALNILDIPILRVVKEYTSVIDEMRDLNLDVAGEFLVMAAQLMHVKSRMLLPKEERAKDREPEADPRAALVQRLLEYQRFKAAAQRLDALPQLGRDVFARPDLPIRYDGPVEEPVREGMDALNLAEVDPFDLIRLFAGILHRQQKVVVHEVLIERISVGARINEVVDIFAADPDAVLFAFGDLVDRFGPRTRRSIIVTFLSMLEMARLKLVKLTQDVDTGLIGIIPVRDNLRDNDTDTTSLTSMLATVDEFGDDPDAEAMP
jgi:segregation and condensation protein A